MVRKNSGFRGDKVLRKERNRKVLRFELVEAKDEPARRPQPGPAEGGGGLRGRTKKKKKKNMSIHRGGCQKRGENGWTTTSPGLRATSTGG